MAPAVRHRLSCHQVGVADLLDALDMLGAYPRQLVLLGLVPQTLELNYGCSPPVEEQLPALVERIVDEARQLGHDLLPEIRDETAVADGRSADRGALGL